MVWLKDKSLVFEYGIVMKTTFFLSLRSELIHTKQRKTDLDTDADLVC